MAYTAGLDAAKAQAWAALLQTELRQTVVGMNIADTKFEGMFESGAKTVHFPRIKATSGGDLANPSATFTPGQIQTEDDSFTLDNHKYWAVDLASADVSQMKADPNNEIIKSLKQFYKEAWDTEILKKIVAGAGTSVGTPTGITITTGEAFYDQLLDIDQKLSEKNVPMNDRFAVISHADHKMLKKFLASRGTTMGDKVLANGYAGDVDGMHIYVSNNLPKTGNVRQVVFGQGKPVCFAADIHPEIIRVGQQYKSNSFVDTIKSQSRFGAKVFLNDADRVAVLNINA